MLAILLRKPCTMAISKYSRLFPRIVPDVQESRNRHEREHPSPQRLHITQGGSIFQGGNQVYGGSQFQGNFVGSGQSFLS